MADPKIHQISRLVRNACFSRFSDSDLGFNALVDVANTHYELAPAIDHVDFSKTGTNFIFGALTAPQVWATTTFRFPLICMYTHGIINKNFIKFRQFSGQVVLGIDVWHSWAKTNVLHDFETYADAFEEIVVEIVNGFGVSGFGEVSQNWGFNVVYNGGVSCSRTEISADAEDWLQGYQFRFTFHLDTTDDATV